MSRPESIADWSPSAASSVAPVLDGDQSACSPRECLNQFTRSTCPTNGNHFSPNVDRFTVGILALVAQRERELISERTRSALRMAKLRGVRLGTRHPHRQVKLMVEGYRRQREGFVSKIRPIIDEIKSTGVTTLKEIGQCLTRRGIPTRTGKTVWYPSTVRTVVS